MQRPARCKTTKTPSITIHHIPSATGIQRGASAAISPVTRAMGYRRVSG